MKKKFLIGFGIVLLVLDFLALDDITTGNEPASALLGEYLMVAGSIPILLIIGFFLFRNRKKVIFLHRKYT